MSKKLKLCAFNCASQGAAFFAIASNRILASASGMPESSTSSASLASGRNCAKIGSSSSIRLLSRVRKGNSPQRHKGHKAHKKKKDHDSFSSSLSGLCAFVVSLPAVRDKLSE